MAASDGWTRLGHIASYRTEVNQLPDDDSRYYKFKHSPLDDVRDVWRHSTDGDNDLIAVHANFIHNNIGDLSRTGLNNIGRSPAIPLPGSQELNFMGRTGSVINRPSQTGGWTSIREKNYGSDSGQNLAPGIHQTRIGAVVPLIDSIVVNADSSFHDRPQLHFSGHNSGPFTTDNIRGSGGSGRRVQNKEERNNSNQLPIESIHTVFKSRRGMRKDPQARVINAGSSNGSGHFRSREKHDGSKSGPFGLKTPFLNSPASFPKSSQRDDFVPSDIQLESSPILVTWT